MKNVTSDFKMAYEKPTCKIYRRITYSLRKWNVGAYGWVDPVELPESSIVSVGPITSKLDTDRINEFKVSNLDITILDTNNEWNPRTGSHFYSLNGDYDPAEPYWTRFKIESGIETSPGVVEYTNVFAGVAVGFSVDAYSETVKINVQGLEAILMNANAEFVSALIENETPTGAINSTNKEFVTLSPGVGIIENVQVNSVDNKPGTHYDISQLNEPTLGAKITFKTAPPTGQTVNVWYRIWKQTQKIEDLVISLLTIAGVEAEANVQAVTFPGGVGDSFSVDSQSDWASGTITDGTYSRSPGDLRIDFGNYNNSQALDLFSDGNFTSNPTWTGEGAGASYSVVSNKLSMVSTQDEGLISTPSNGARNGIFEYELTVNSINWGEPIDFHFVGTSKQYNPISPFGAQYLSGDWVSLYSKASSPGTLYWQLYLDGVLKGQVEAAVSVGTGTPQYIKVVAIPQGEVSVYHNNVKKISATRTSNPISNFVGFSTGRGGLYGDSDCLVDSVVIPKNTPTCSWTSPTYDMTSTVASFGTFISNYVSGDGTVTISTRTSANGSTWESWVVVSSNGNVNSTLQRYIQIKVELSMPSSGLVEPFVSYMKLNYTKSVTTIKLANFTGKTCYQALQSLGAFSNYEWGFDSEEKFFFREKTVSKYPLLDLNYSKNLIDLSVMNYGYDDVYSEVQATFGSYDIILKDPGTRSGPLARYGRKRLTIDGGDLLISPDTDVASGIATGLMTYVSNAWINFKARLKLTAWIELSDTVSINYGTEYVNFLCKVVGVRHDLDNMVSELDLREINAFVAPFENNSFEDGLTGWTTEGTANWGISDGSSVLAKDGTKYVYRYRNNSSGFWTTANGIRVQIRNSGGTVLQTLTLDGFNSGLNWKQRTIPMSAYAGQTVKIAVGDNVDAFIVSPLFVSTGEDIKFFAMCENTGLTHYNFLDLFHI